MIFKKYIIKLNFIKYLFDLINLNLLNQFFFINLNNYNIKFIKNIINFFNKLDLVCFTIL